MAGGLLNEQLHLSVNIDHLLMREIIACVEEEGRERKNRMTEYEGEGMGRGVTFDELLCWTHLSVSA